MNVMDDYRARWLHTERRMGQLHGFTKLNMQAAYYGGGAAMAAMYFRADPATLAPMVTRILDDVTTASAALAGGETWPASWDGGAHGMFGGGWEAFAQDMENAGIAEHSPEGENLCVMFYAGGAAMAALMGGIRKSQLVAISAECVIEMRRAADTVKALMKQGGHV